MRPSPVRIAIRVVIGLVAVVAIVPAALLVALQNRGVARWAANGLLALVDPYPGRAVTVGAVRGDWWTGITLIGVRLGSPASTPAIAIDTVRLRYASLLHIARTLELGELYVNGLAVTTRQRADGQWDLLSPFAATDSSTASDTTPGRPVTVSRFTVRRASLIAYARDDSARTSRARPLLVSDFRVHARHARLGAAPEVRIDSLGAHVVFPDSAMPPLDVALAGDLTAGRLTLPRLTATPGGTRITAHGTLQLPDTAHHGLRDVDVVVDARPARFADLAPLVPALATRDSAIVHVEARGSSDSVRIRANVDLPRNGRITIGGTLTPRTTDVAAALDVQLRDVDPRVLFAKASRPGSVSGALEVNVRGPSLREASGTATLELAPTVRYGKWTARGVIARATVRRGVAHIAVQGDMRPWRLAARATLAPFDSVRTYDAWVRVLSIGTHPAALDTATLAVALRGNRITFAARGAIGGGTARADGHAMLGTPIAWRVTEGSLARVNLSRVMGDTGAGAVTATFTADGRGTSPATLAAHARIHLAPSAFGAIRVRGGDASLSMRAGTAQLAATALFGAGTIAADLSATPLGTQPALTVRRLAFTHIDARSFAGDSALPTDLSGVLTGRARWTAHAGIASTLRGGARLAVSGSRVGTQRIDSAAASVTLGDGVAAWSTSAYLPRGGLALAGTARPFGALPALDVEHGSFSHLDLAALAGLSDEHTDLNGTLHARVLGLDPDSARWSVALALAASTVRDAAIDSARLALALDSGFVHLAASVHGADGHGDGTMDGRLVASYAARPFSLGRVLAEADLTAHARATWTLAAMTPDTSIMLDVVDTVTPPPDSLTASARLAGGRLSLDTLRVRSVLGTLTGAGAAAVSSSSARARPAPSDLRLSLVVGDLAPLASVLGARLLAVDSGRVEAALTGDAEAPRVRVTARVRGLAESDARVDALDADLAASLAGVRAITDARGTVKISDADVRGVHADRLDVALAYGDTAARLAASTTLDDGTAARLVVTAIPDSIRHALRLDSLDVDRGPHHWALAHPVRVAYGERYTVDDFVLASDAGPRVAIDGTVSRTGAERMSLLLDSISLAPFARALGYHALAGATLNAKATLGGTATAPRLHADATVTLAGAGAGSGSMHGVVDWTASRLDLTAALTPRDGHALTASGYLPVRLVLAASAAGPVSVAPHGAVDLHVAATDFNLQIVEPFLNQETIDRARGSLTTEARITGAADAPRLAGRLALRGLSLRLPSLGVTYEKGVVRAELADDRLRIDTAVVRSGDGTLRLTGGLVLRQLTVGEFDAQAVMRGFRAVWSDAYQVVVSGNLAFKGTTRAPVLTGSIIVDNGTLDLSATASGGSAQPVTLTEAQLHSIEARFGRDAVRAGGAPSTPFFDLLALDLKVTADRDAWVRRRANPQLQIELGGAVTVRKDPRGPLRLFGTLEPVEGRSFVSQFGRRFMVTEGELTFNGAPDRVRIDIKTQYAVPSSGDPNAAEVTIGLDVSGTPQRMRLVLSSDPQMNNSDIISYIATGRPEGEGLGIGGTGSSSGLAMQAGTSLALGQLQSVVQGLAKDKLQLDVMEIRQDGLRGATLVAGRYVSPSVYVGFAQPLGFGEATTDPLHQNLYPEAQVEYGAFRWLLLRLEGGVSDVRFLLRSRYAY